MTQNELNKSLPETTSRGYCHIKKILDQGADIEESAAHSREFIRELAAQDLLFKPGMYSATQLY